MSFSLPIALQVQPVPTDNPLGIGLLIVFLFLAVLLFVIGASAIKIVSPYQRGVVERLGKYARTAQPGLNFVTPFIESLTKVDMRERVLDVPPQEVITKDNVGVTVDAVIYFEITDPVRVMYQVQDFMLAAMKLAQTNLRNIVGDLELDQTLTSRERINSQLRQILDDATDKWGVRVTRVEIQKIDPPKPIMEAMSHQMKAERTKRAAILEAEGVRQSQILRAEGEKQSAILEAEGQAQAIKAVADAEKYRRQVVAEGEGQAIKTVFDAIHSGRPTSDLLAIKYLEALEKIANGHATKIFLPLEATSALGAIAGLGEVFRATQQSESVPAPVPIRPAAE